MWYSQRLYKNFILKIFLKYRQSFLFTGLSCMTAFSAMAELTLCDRNDMSQRINIVTIWPFTKKNDKSMLWQIKSRWMLTPLNLAFKIAYNR